MFRARSKGGFLIVYLLGNLRRPRTPPIYKGSLLRAACWRTPRPVSCAVNRLGKLSSPNNEFKYITYGMRGDSSLA